MKSEFKGIKKLAQNGRAQRYKYGIWIVFDRPRNGQKAGETGRGHCVQAAISCFDRPPLPCGGRSV